MKANTIKSILLTAAVLLSTQIWAYDFSAVCSTGQTLYYKINGNNVTVTFPGSQSHYSYNGYQKPAGNLVIPDSVTHDETTYPVTAIGDYAFDMCSDLIAVTIPNTVTSIKSFAFEACGLTGLVTIPNSVVSVENYAFVSCMSVTSLELGNSVASIGIMAFNCPYISSITVHRMTPPTIDYTTFSGIDPCIPVHIPCSSLFTYQTMAFWFNFTNYQEGEFGYIFSVTSNDTVKGYVSVLAPPDCSNPQAFIQAVSNPGYTFTHWSDGNTDNPRTIVVTQDVFLVAIFEDADGMGENKPETVSVYPNPTEGTFTIEAENIIGVEIFDLAGQNVLTDRSGNQTISAGNLTTGVYFLKVETRNETRYGKLIKK